MNKDETLEMSQEPRKSEELEKIDFTSKKIAFIACSGLMFFQLLFNMLNGRQSHGLLALFFLYATAEEITKYTFLRKKTSLISISVCLIATVTSLVSYIYEVIR